MAAADVGLSSHTTTQPTAMEAFPSFYHYIHPSGGTNPIKTASTAHYTPPPVPLPRAYSYGFIVDKQYVYARGSGTG